jgi:diguanylate cyclase
MHFHHFGNTLLTVGPLVSARDNDRDGFHCMLNIPKLQRSTWVVIARRTALHTTGSVLLSVLACHLLLSIFSQGLGTTGVVAAALMPILIGGPMIFYLSVRHQELCLAYDRLEHAASRDSLTDCLNHGAFAEQVGATLRNADNPCGALLVVDADHFKSINDRFGHDRGDVALKLIAATIRSTVRSTDLVGRLGGEEFGIFLPGASRATAQAIAECIRHAVATSVFEVGGHSHPLSVSVGGAVFDSPISFTDLFRSADRRMYAVKNSGRNSVDLVAMDAGPVDAVPLAKAG